MLYTGTVPEETRAAEQDFTTTYSRPLPGAARMYPETDIPAIEVPEKRIEDIDQNLPDTLDEREERYAEEIGEELASQIVHSENLLMFENFKDSTDPKLVANVFTNIISGLEDRGIDIDQLEQKDFTVLFEAVSEERIKKGDIEDVLEQMTSESPEKAIEQVVESKSGEDEIRKTVQQILEENSEMIEDQGMHAQGALMGMVMGRVEADGGTVSKILQQELEKKIN